MGKETVGLKLDSEIAQKFKDIQKEHGSAQEFVEILLNAHLERQVETDTDSPVHKEKVRVKKALADVERVVSGFLEIAASDKIQAKTEAQEKVTAALGELDQCKEVSENLKDLNKDHAIKIGEQKKIIAGLQESAESIQALKDAWEIEKTNLTNRLAELDQEAKEARELKKNLAGNEKELVAAQGKLALAEQQHDNDRAVIADGKSQLVKEGQRIETNKQNHKDEITELKKAHATEIAKKEQELFDLVDDHRKVNLQIRDENHGLVDAAKALVDELHTEKLACSEKMSEIKTAAAEEHGRLVAKVQLLENSLVNQKKLAKT